MRRAVGASRGVVPRRVEGGGARGLLPRLAAVGVAGCFAGAVLPGSAGADATAAGPSSNPSSALPRAAAGAPIAVRLVPETRGRGKAQRLVTRLDAFSADGVRRRVRTIGRGGLFAAPALSPDGRRVAFARPDGRIAVVAVGDGALRTLRPPGLPRPRPAGDEDVTRWFVVEGAAVSWSPDGRVLVAHGLVRRNPERWVSSLSQARTVACVVATGRCTTAGPGAPADLLPLRGDRALRLDGPDATDDRESDATNQLPSTRLERLVLRHRTDPVRTAASLATTSTGGRRTSVLRSVRSTGRRGIVTFGGRASGPAGVLLRRTSVAFRPQTPNEGFPVDDPGVRIRARVLTPWVVTPTGRLRTLPLRLAVTPIGALADGRWILGSPEARPTRDNATPEPGLTTLDARGRTALLRVGGRPVTPVRLALESGLPDTFAVGAGIVTATPVGDDLLVELQDSGSGGTFFFPADAALVRVPLDGSAPARLIDHEGAASYAVR